MTTFRRERIRIALDTEKRVSINDIVTGENPEAWRGTDIQFELGFFFNDSLIDDVTNIDTVTLTIKPNDNRQGVTLMQATIGAADLNPVLTVEEWEDQTNQHCIIPFAAAETALDLDGQNEKDFWLVVTALTNDATPRRLVLGAAILTMLDDGVFSGANTPALGSSLIPLAATYSAGGAYTLTLEAGKTYQWAPGANDTNVVNGTETLTASGNFTAQGSSVVLNGTANALITATVRGEVYFTADQVNAKLNGLAKLVNPPGVNMTFVSPSGQYARVFGVADDGSRYDQIIDTTA